VYRCCAFDAIEGRCAVSTVIRRQHHCPIETLKDRRP
jgi:hypothetical protein